jgi:phytoene desaturase
MKEKIIIIGAGIAGLSAGCYARMNGYDAEIYALAPEGKTIVESTFMVNDFNYWEELYKDKPAYKAEKEKILKLVSEELEKKYPGFISQIEVSDVLTPMTYVRYTGNYRGSYMTWVMTPGFMKRHRMVKKTLPGLENFWLSGM